MGTRTIGGTPITGVAPPLLHDVGTRGVVAVRTIVSVAWRSANHPHAGVILEVALAIGATLTIGAAQLLPLAVVTRMAVVVAVLAIADVAWRGATHPLVVGTRTIGVTRTTGSQRGAMGTLEVAVEATRTTESVAWKGALQSQGVATRAAVDVLMDECEISKGTVKYISRTIKHPNNDHIKENIISIGEMYANLLKKGSDHSCSLTYGLSIVSGFFLKCTLNVPR